jgi:hypothetical protein
MSRSPSDATTHAAGRNLTKVAVNEGSLEIAGKYRMVVSQIVRGKAKELSVSGGDEMNHSPSQISRRKAMGCTDVHIERRLRYQTMQIQSRDMRRIIGLPFHVGGDYRVSISEMKIDAPHFEGDKVIKTSSDRCD